MEYRAEELAIKAGTTVRNLRAYRDHGLLPPPQRRGRVATYNDDHLDRLQLIAKLIQRGYTLANIGELLKGHARGIDVADLLGVEAALLEPDPSGFGSVLSGRQLVELFGEWDESDESRIDAAIDVGLLIPLDPETPLPNRRFRIRKPRGFRAGRDLVEAGVPIDLAIAQSGEIARLVEPIARHLVTIVAEQIISSSSTLSDDHASRREQIVSIIQRLRPLAGAVVAEELSLAMDEMIRQHLANLLDGILTQSDRSDESPNDEDAGPDAPPQR